MMGISTTRASWLGLPKTRDKSASGSMLPPLPPPPSRLHPVHGSSWRLRVTITITITIMWILMTASTAGFGDLPAQLWDVLHHSPLIAPLGSRAQAPWVWGLGFRILDIIHFKRYF